MSELYHTDENFKPPYWDRKYYTTFADQIEALHGSSTIYVGNLSFYTSELQIHETLSVVGPIKRIIMGLNKNTKTPCGFCFVEYFTHEHAVECLKFIHQTKCDDRIIKCELDGGFHEGRQYGRGAMGGQIRDEKRTTIDTGRGSIVKPGMSSSSSSSQSTMSSSLGKRGHDRYDRYDRGGNQRGGYNGGKDKFGRDYRPPPPPPPPARSPRPPSEPLNPLADSDIGQNNHAEVGNRQNEEDEDERPKKNRRFRDADEGGDNDEN